jgi:chromosome segregation ATPase
VTAIESPEFVEESAASLERAQAEMLEMARERDRLRACLRLTRVERIEKLEAELAAANVREADARRDHERAMKRADEASAKLAAVEAERDEANVHCACIDAERDIALQGLSASEDANRRLREALETARQAVLLGVDTQEQSDSIVRAIGAALAPAAEEVKP